MAEGVGFEPTGLCSPTVFKTAAFNHSANPPVSRGDGGGRGGIRTHGALAGPPVFETGAIDHSATRPGLWSKKWLLGLGSNQRWGC